MRFCGNIQLIGREPLGDPPVSFLHLPLSLPHHGTNKTGWGQDHSVGFRQRGIRNTISRDNLENVFFSDQYLGWVFHCCVFNASCYNLDETGFRLVTVYRDLSPPQHHRSCDRWLNKCGLIDLITVEQGWSGAVGVKLKPNEWTEPGSADCDGSRWFTRSLQIVRLQQWETTSLIFGAQANWKLDIVSHWKTLNVKMMNIVSSLALLLYTSLFIYFYIVLYSKLIYLYFLWKTKPHFFMQPSVVQTNFF